MYHKVIGVFCLIAIMAGCGASSNEPVTALRVGYLPNITHAQPLIGLSDGSFASELGSIEIQPHTFNAGPSVIEALFAEQIDIAYVGPSPSVNGFVQSEGQAIRIVGGSMLNGAAFVVQPELAEAYRASGDQALIGKTFSSPQQGNTQDVSLRMYLKERNLLDEVTVSPMANADQLTMFRQRQIAGSWSVEPWVSRLVQEAGGEILVDERTLWPDNTFATTVVIVRTEFLEAHPEIVEQWLRGHVKVTEWIQNNPTEAQVIANEKIKELTGSALTEDVLKSAWSRLEPSVNPNKQSIETFHKHADTLNYIQSTGLDFNTLYDFSILSRITGEQY